MTIPSHSTMPRDDGAGNGFAPAGQAPSAEQILADIQAKQEEVLNNAERAAVELARRFIPAIDVARQLLPVEDIELVAETLSRHLGPGSALPREVQAQIHDGVLTLHRNLGGLIQHVTNWIENYEYSNVEQAAAALPAAHLRVKAQTMVAADKQLRFSARSLRIAVELFERLNGEIVRMIETAHLDPMRERALVLANAVLVYETADFAVKYLEHFQIGGIGELDSMYEAMATDIAQTRGAIMERRRQIEDTTMDVDRQQVYLSECDDNENALRRTEEVWAQYIEEQRAIASGLSSDLIRLLPDLRVRRDLSHDRISVLSKVALTGFLRQNIEHMKSAVISITGFKLAPLTPSRLNRLMGINESE